MQVIAEERDWRSLSGGDERLPDGRFDLALEHRRIERRERLYRLGSLLNINGVLEIGQNLGWEGILVRESF